jgi:hypothetical protein
MEVKNFRIAYSDYGDVESTLYTKVSDLALAKQLTQSAGTLEEAKYFVKLCAWDKRDHDCVDSYGDPLCTRISGVQNTENLEGLFLFMKGCWHYSDDGIGWDRLDEAFPEMFTQEVA